MVTDITIKKGYKQTELGVIPEDWSIDTLGKFIKITSGESPSKFRFIEDGIPYYKVDQLNLGNKYQKETPYFIKYSKPVPSKSLLFPKRGASILLNKLKITENESFFDTNLMALTILGDLYYEYLYYYLLYFGLWRIADTTSIPQINNKHINPLKFYFPSKKNEQTAIATVLSDTDALIESLGKLIAKKKAIKQGAMQQLLTGKKRLPGFSGEWDVKKLGEICEIKKGQLITDRSRIEGNIPVIAGGKVPAYFHNKSNRNGKTITISASGASAGYVAFHTRPIFASDCSTIEETRSYSIEFIYFLLQSLQERIYKMQTGGAQLHIHPSDLNPIIVSVPKLEEQTSIATILSDMDSEIEKLEQKRDKYTMLKQGMMQQLLTGRIRIYDNN